MKCKLFLILAVIPVLSQADDAMNEFLKMIVPGEYTVIGKNINSDKTYQGEVSITRQDDTFAVMRSINGTKIVGQAAIESAAGGDAKVLRIRFEENNVNYEETCLVSSDLDNYARISCYLYMQDGKTRQPGLEALFIRRH
jgi:hypothetical protein